MKFLYLYTLKSLRLKKDKRMSYHEGTLSVASGCTHGGDLSIQNLHIYKIYKSYVIYNIILVNLVNVQILHT